MLILESIVTTRNPDGSAHIAPLGVWSDAAARPVLAPFRPSATLDNLLREKIAVINRTDDVRIFAGCLTGRRDWPTVASEKVAVARLGDALSHREVEIVEVEDDDLRPRLHCKVVHEATHAPFAGFNRAQAAVVELAILVSRLDMLESDKIKRELNYLQIAIDKTAGAHELEAWEWLLEKIRQHPTHRASVKSRTS